MTITVAACATCCCVLALGSTAVTAQLLSAPEIWHEDDYTGSCAWDSTYDSNAGILYEASDA